MGTAEPQHDHLSRIECARAATISAPRLKRSQFFAAYPCYEKWRSKNHGLATTCLNSDLVSIENAALQYFQIKHAKREGAVPNRDFSFEVFPKEGGTRSGIRCTVKMHGDAEPSSYNFKSHHFGTSSWTVGSGKGPDVRELLIYKLLELIGVGPIIDYALPWTESVTALYIVSSWRNDFKRLDQIHPPHLLELSTLVEIHLLQILLHLSDLKEDNVGQWGNGNLIHDTESNTAMVDFFVSRVVKEYNSQELLAMLHEKNCKLGWVAKPVGWKGIPGPYEMFESSKLFMRDHYAKAALDLWDLPRVLDEAVEILHNEGNLDTIPTTTYQRQFIEDGRLTERPSSELKLYVATIKANVLTLRNALG